MIDPEEKDNQERPAEDIVDYWHGNEVDISMPDIPLPTAVEKKIDTHEDKCDVSFKFAFVGSGQGGSRIAEAFHQLGYRKISAINTAQQDLNTIRLDNKLCIGDGGAGKDPTVAEGLYMSKREDVLDFMYDSFGEDVDRIFVCAGAGGGSGSGTVCPLVDTALEMQKSIKCKSDKVGVILALPKHSEGKKVNANAYNTLNRVWQMVEENKVSPLIILDNEKINKLYPGLAVAPFWRTANRSVAGLFHLFNHTAARNSSFSAFDSNDYKQILDSGLILFGASPVADWKSPTGISRCVRDNLRNNMLSGGIDINSGDSAGVVIIGGQKILEEAPQENLDRAFDQFSRMLRKGNVVHRGIYSGDKDNLIVYTAVGGIAKPVNKLEELRQLGDLT
jgi:cell division GTPase FtsZ